MTNAEILEKLENRDASNAESFLKYMPEWNENESFPINEIRRYIRFNEWTKKDFNFETELVVQSTLPDWCHDIYFELKEFRDNSRNELTSVQETFARIYGYPAKTQDEKAFVIYQYALQRYFESSEIHKENVCQNS